MNALSNILAKNAPKAWSDFRNFANKYNALTIGNDFTSIPFEMQLGIYLSYFHENNIELDLVNPDLPTLEESIKETFINFEKVIGHYS